VVQFGDGHWEAKVNGESLYHREGEHPGPFGLDGYYLAANRYSTKELALAAAENAKADETRRQALRDKDARAGRVLQVVVV
jgi:hypothetical protein